ncbi:MAG: efflux RND transporter periplasmic adaptor subunit [Chthoniobacteraceae bacterium]|nr:efflux RND transporter periplasmic adaptor subunit [Chthoniobacteraceae bacterium]
MKNQSHSRRHFAGFLSIAGGVTLAACVLAGCNRTPNGTVAPGAGAGKPALPPPQVGVVTVKAESVAMVTELPGRIATVRTAEVRARATGILLKRLFTEGSDVKADDVLFQIDEAPLRASLDSAKAMLAKAEANQKQAQAKAERYKTLVAINAVSKQDYDEAVATAGQGEADVLTGKAAVETAQLNLGYAKVAAPISGRIGKAKVTEGALVTAAEATQMATIQQLDPIYFDFTQSSTEMLRLKRDLEAGRLKSVAPGQVRVTLLLEDGSTYTQEGKLVFSDVTVDPTTGMVTMRAEFPNPEGMLLPGMFARAKLEQAVEKGAITVPQRGLTRNPDGTGTVFVVGKDNTVEPRIVKTTNAIGNKWLVAGGLQAGDRVIVEGLQKIRPGGTVVPVPFEGATASVPVALSGL